MKEMIKRMREEKGGFTLAELLIVVAIVLVLVAIAIPVFTGALNEAERSVENANIHSVRTAGATAILLEPEAFGINAQTPTTAWTVNATVSAEGTVAITGITASVAGEESATKDAKTGVYTVIAHVEQTDLPAAPGTTTS